MKGKLTEKSVVAVFQPWVTILYTTKVAKYS